MAGENHIYGDAVTQARTVLVIDDDQAIRETLHELFEAEGYRVLCAENGREGLGLLAGLEAPAVVLLDQNMPVMNGAEFLREKSLESRFDQVPVLLMSAERPRHEGGGIAQFLPKPFNVVELLEAVDRFSSAPAGALSHS